MLRSRAVVAGWSSDVGHRYRLQKFLLKGKEGVGEGLLESPMGSPALIEHRLEKGPANPMGEILNCCHHMNHYNTVIGFELSRNERVAVAYLSGDNDHNTDEEHPRPTEPDVPGRGKCSWTPGCTIESASIKVVVEVID